MKINNQIFLKALMYLIKSVVVLLAAFIFYLFYNASHQVDLESWHTISIPEDKLVFRDFHSIEDYFKAEERFMGSIIQSVALPETSMYTRYAENNPSSPLADGVDLNRSFHLFPDSKPYRGGILLLHGLTDSPYHMRALSEFFSARGYYVLAMRMPGHGTIPRALDLIEWQDWYRAAELGIRFVVEENKKHNVNNLYLGGFSTGGAVALHYTLKHFGENGWYRPKQLFLFAPAIGIDPLAALAKLNRIISWIPGFEKLRWEETNPEYDPFKYNSMPFNAASELQKLIDLNSDLVNNLADDQDALQQFPPIFSVESIADATVNPEKLVELHSKICDERSQLLMFDVNHLFDSVLKTKFLEKKQNFQSDSLFRKSVTLISNHRTKSFTRQDEPIKEDKSISKTFLYSIHNTRLDTLGGLQWPANIFALSHVSIVISENDVYYGKNSVLGGLTIKGESNVLSLGGDLTRLRYNPFLPLVFQFMEKRVK